MAKTETKTKEKKAKKPALKKSTSKKESKVAEEKKKIKEKKPAGKKTPANLKKEKASKPKGSTDRYWEAVGRRKTSTARVRFWAKGNKQFLINDKLCPEYFLRKDLQQIALASLEKMKIIERFHVSVKVKGGGLHSQAEAIRHAMARVLVKFNPNFQKRLKKAGFLTRDSRMRERKKFGLKRARRAPQWRKR